MHDAEDTGSQSGLIVIQKYCRVNPPVPAGQSTLSTLHAAIVKCLQVTWLVFAAWQTPDLMMHYNGDGVHICADNTNILDL